MIIPVNPGSLPVGYCPAGYQDLLNQFAAAMSVNLPSGLSSIAWQATAPTPASNVAWGKLDSLGRPVGIYYFAQGAWLSPHPTVSGLTMWWFAALPDFTVFDGGDGNEISAISGPMWQLAQDINGNTIAARFPVAQGTFPSGAVLQLGTNGGQETQYLVDSQQTVPSSHMHIYGRGNNDATSGLFVIAPGTDTAPSLIGQAIGYAGSYETEPLSSAAGPYLETGGVVTPNSPTSSPVTQTPLNMIPPYVVGYLLQRSARLFYVG